MQIKLTDAEINKAKQVKERKIARELQKERNRKADEKRLNEVRNTQKPIKDKVLKMLRGAKTFNLIRIKDKLDQDVCCLKIDRLQIEIRETGCLSLVRVFFDTIFVADLILEFSTEIVNEIKDMGRKRLLSAK